MATDVLGREIRVDDYVFHYNYVYLVKSVTSGGVKALIQPPSKTSKSKTILGRECALLAKEDVLLWTLKTGKSF